VSLKNNEVSRKRNGISDENRFPHNPFVVLHQSYYVLIVLLGNAHSKYHFLVKKKPLPQIIFTMA